MERQPISHHGKDGSGVSSPITINDAGGKDSKRSFDLLDELELLLHRKGHLPVLLVTVIALALCFLVIGILLATAILLVTFFVFVCFNENPSEVASSLNVLRNV